MGTVNGLLRYLVDHQVQVGVRVREGPATGELEWRRPNRVMLQDLLRHPMYAGAYVYGRTHIDPRRRRPGRPGSGQVRRAPEQWPVLLRDRVPAYISWDQYERQQERLRANRARAEARGGGPPRAVAAGRAARLRPVRLPADGALPPGRWPRHLPMTRQLTDFGGPACQHMAGWALDQWVSQAVLAALEPAALELSLTAAAQVERDRADLERRWQQRLERAAYAVERAARQYRLAEPENRLVGGSWSASGRPSWRRSRNWRRPPAAPSTTSRAGCRLPSRRRFAGWPPISRACGRPRRRPTPTARRSSARWWSASSWMRLARRSGCR